jgi:hypothetical protein
MREWVKKALYKTSVSGQFVMPLLRSSKLKEFCLAVINQILCRLAIGNTVRSVKPHLGYRVMSKKI